jgi:leucyl aminopeptidase (aminopeptidase T)
MSDVTASELSHAARILLASALKVRARERFVVVCDLESAAIGEAIAREATTIGAAVTLARLDLLKSVSTGHSGDRPHKVLPDEVRRGMLAAQASVFVASSPHQELSMREQLLHIVGACGVQHAHMPGIGARAFAAGMRLDYEQVSQWGRGVLRRLEYASQETTDSAAGTELRLTFNAANRWVPRLGQLAPGKWVNFPAGAIYASPQSADGVFVANASLGEFFGAREGLLIKAPVKLFIEAGKVTKVETKNAQFQADIEQMLAFGPNSDRVGLVAVGVNDGIDAPTGEAIVDQNVPGLHLFIGDPAGKTTGVQWSARTSFAACQAGANVSVDGMTTILRGKLALA